jgi:hypothetical protein
VAIPSFLFIPLTGVYTAAQETTTLFEQEKATHLALQERARGLEVQVQEIENLNRTISLLVSEKSSLSASIENLQGVQAREYQ